jgi:DNA-binding transcriptional LysR family regulator
VLIRQLEYLVAVAREGHFGRAAAACWVSQPSLSDGISRLESELGVSLVRRGRRYEGLTPEGVRLVAWAQRVLGERDELLGEFAAYGQDLAGRLRLGVIPTALPPVPLITELFHQRHPQVAITVTSLSSDEIIRRLTAFELDAGLTYMPLDSPHPDLRFLPLFQERYVVVTGRAGPLGDSTVVTWAEVAQVPLCLLTTDMQNRRMLDARFEQDGVVVSPAIETDSLPVLAGHLRTGRWTSIVPQSWLPLFDLSLETGFFTTGSSLTMILPMSGPELSSAVGLVVPAREPLPVMVEALLEVVADLDLQAALDLPMPTTAS